MQQKGETVKSVLPDYWKNTHNALGMLPSNGTLSLLLLVSLDQSQIV